ncbi:MAG TPA: hypothetical protein VFL57_20950, partial [Bryobacteraceae bacterium]|nr:hypothetical protein [Bryobacteraceae bacterium]
MPRRWLAWAALAVASALTVYGLFHNHLFAQEIWTPLGRQRLLIFAAAFALWTALLRFFRTGIFVAATTAVALTYAVLVAGPLAVAAVLVIVYACWLLGGGRDLTDLCLGLAILVFVLSFAVHARINYIWTYAAVLALIIAVRRRA